ncbi:MAG TPA: DUF4391 domain-containing protein [Chitinispirillaceae bacterium]|nr:DUF4391 domain-containing protein [Chitinispirillaceae bacterium]
MADTIIELFTLPKSSLIDRKLDKKKLFEHGGITGSQQKIISEAVETIRVLASVNTKTTNIPPVDTSEYRYNQIPIIRVEMRKSERALVCGKIIQKALEHPALLVITGNDSKMIFHAATKRVNSADISKLTIEHEYSTNWVDRYSTLPEDSLFLSSFMLGKHPLSDLQSLYHSYCKVIISHAFVQITGKSVSGSLSLDMLRMYFDKYKELGRELTTLQNAAVREKQVPRQIELNNAIRRVRDELVEIETILNNGRINAVVSDV